MTLRDYTGSTCVSGTCTPSYSDTICPVACIGATCVECVVDTDCDPGWECNSSNVCVMSGCPPPVGSCVNGSEDMDGCGDARTIGRASAAPGWSHSDDLCWGASDNLDEGSCSDGGDDHAYRIYMLSGERIDIELYSSWPCDIDGWDWDITFKIYQNSGCSDTACTTMERCETWISHTWSGSFTAPHDGWFFLVVDSQSSWDDRMGDYDIDVTLTCNNPPTCDC